MIKWIAFLSDGSKAVEGEGDWKEIPGESLPWRRLCEYLEKEKMYIDKLVVADYDDESRYTGFPKHTDDTPPLFYSVQYDVELNNILGGPTSETFIHLAAHWDDQIWHMYKNISTEDQVVRYEKSDKYVPMCPSPSRFLIEQTN